MRSKSPKPGHAQFRDCQRFWFAVAGVEVGIFGDADRSAAIKAVIFSRSLCALKGECHDY